MRSIPWAFLCIWLLVVTQGKPLLPFKQPARAVPRSLWRREVVPRDVVTLSYAPEGSHRPTSSLTFSAYEDVPVLVLEDIDFLVETVVCPIALNAEESAAEISFLSEDAYAAALATWSSLPKFILVTSHSGCNPDDQRGAWLVSSVLGEDFKCTVSLEVLSIPLRTIGSSFHISHVTDSVSTGWRSPTAPQLRRRDLDDIDKVLPVNKTFDFDPRQQLLPIDSSLIDSSLNDFIPDPAGLQVFCVDCVSALDFSVGLEMDITDNLSVSSAAVNVTVNEFNYDINLEISMDGSHAFNTEFDVITMPIPDLGASFKDVATLGFFWGGAFRTDLTFGGAVNFTVGASANIPSGATATFVATDVDQSSATGWDKASFKVHPFKLNSGSFSVTAGISLSPFIDATIQVGSGNGSSARLYLDTPHISGTATLAANVNRECQSLGPDDFESFADAFTFGAGVNISLEANSSGALFPNFDKVLLTKGFPFGTLPTVDDPKCMVFADDSTAGSNDANSIASLLPAVTGTLLPAASAIPTFNIPGIESYYSAHSGTLPTNVNYIQMLQATTVPTDILPAVQKAAAAQAPNKHHSKIGAIVGGVIGGIAVVILVAIGVWYLRFRSPKESEAIGGWAPGSLPKTGALTPGSHLEGKDYLSHK
ncbi:hypothetical protein MSAN_01124500 [Mycena sanguinolenta]|uniref:Peptidase A1 domain-containing protein n=1 Tax=Mycena sanguinolenta TaxID=230812 RepID=A0A8H6YKZ4_9AGAR|nr:hypothetical protein MSAN_01124500 [Mycena sanguinolenta]